MNRPALVILTIVGIVVLCGALGQPILNPQVQRRCGPPMSITVHDDLTGGKLRHFVIPVWYEYPARVGELGTDTERRALRGFHFEFQDGTILRD